MDRLLIERVVVHKERAELRQHPLDVTTFVRNLEALESGSAAA